MMPKPYRHDSGFTLIEVLVAVVVLGLGVTALITALAMHAKTTYGNRNQAQSATTLTAAAEYVKSLPWTSTLACDGTTTDITSAVSHDSAITSIKYGPATAVGATPCTLLRQFPVTVSGNGFTLSATVVKRPTDLP
jgi:prepilin-type N-terminal cleavage/methylation domain-containing protein